ncbi:hypothetical protein ISCGN_023463 [Ixodes scapularis]
MLDTGRDPGAQCTWSRSSAGRKARKDSPLSWESSLGTDTMNHMPDMTGADRRASLGTGHCSCPDLGRLLGNGPTSRRARGSEVTPDPQRRPDLFCQGDSPVQAHHPAAAYLRCYRRPLRGGVSSALPQLAVTPRQGDPRDAIAPGPSTPAWHIRAPRGESPLAVWECPSGQDSIASFIPPTAMTMHRLASFYFTARSARRPEVEIRNSSGGLSSSDLDPLSSIGSARATRGSSLEACNLDGSPGFRDPPGAEGPSPRPRGGSDGGAGVQNPVQATQTPALGWILTDLHPPCHPGVEHCALL